MNNQVEKDAMPVDHKLKERVSLFVDDKEFHVEREAFSGAEIMALAGIKLEEGLVLILEDGSQCPVKAEELVELTPGRRFKKAPRFRRG